MRIEGPFMPVLFAADVTVHLLGRGVHVHHARVSTRVGLGQAYLQRVRVLSTYKLQK